MPFGRDSIDYTVCLFYVFVLIQILSYTNCCRCPHQIRHMQVKTEILEERMRSRRLENGTKEVVVDSVRRRIVLVRGTKIRHHVGEDI